MEFHNTYLGNVLGTLHSRPMNNVLMFQNLGLFEEVATNFIQSKFTYFFFVIFSLLKI